MIHITKPVIPDREKLNQYLDGVCERTCLTNNGPLVQELTHRLEEYLGVENLLLVANGTLALQVAYKALGIEKEAITTPFTFAATPGSMKWQGINPRFADIDSKTLNLDPFEAERQITSNTEALVPVHVYGNACDVASLKNVANRNRLKLVYDASHAFGVRYHGESILNWGDAATISFHATKLFHTVEGGAIIFRQEEDLERAKAMINFGQTQVTPDDIAMPGINAKMSEVHAAFGLVNLDVIDQIIDCRQNVVQEYLHQLKKEVSFSHCVGSENGSYFPIMLENSTQTEQIHALLKREGICSRRYFRPPLHQTLEYSDGSHCPVASNTANRVICLPIYPELEKATIEKVVHTLNLAKAKII